MPISAVTFDIWETILADGSDEPKRAARGLLTKPAARRQTFWETLNRQAPIDKATTDLAFDMHEAAFRKAWHGLHVTWDVPDRIDILLDGLGRSLPVGERDALIAAFETMELDVVPDLIPGAAEAIAELAGRYKLGVISDTIYTPGRGLRALLADHGVERYFSGFVFSDEVGRAKPHADCFRSAARQLGTAYADMVHIGDRDAKDIRGAQVLGMKAILFTAARDEGAGPTTRADAVVAAYADLAAAIDALAGG